MDTSKLKENVTKILRNKNTFTILIVFAYNWRINQATTLVQIPYAKKEINSRQEITSDAVGYMQVPKSVINNTKNLKSSSAGVVNKFVNYGCTIPQYSLFYDSCILSESAKPESEFKDLAKDYTVYQLEVDFDSTYGNSIYPGNYIDLYVKTVDKSSDKIIFGRLIKGIKVMAVYDGSGQDVFESTSEARTPKYMWFAVPNDLYELLRKAEFANVIIMPIPRNASYSTEERTPEIDSTYIQNFILEKSVNFGNK